MVSTSQPTTTTARQQEADQDEHQDAADDRAIATVMLKFNASLPWSATKGIVSVFTSHTTSGPSTCRTEWMKPDNEDRWASMPQVFLPERYRSLRAFP
jgi:hypothetical protein